jgi:polynucleotide 5'-hydroxyl-kinase GRC3/NOL9
VLVVGDTDAGKTTFVTQLANALRAREHEVGIVDADVGQSEIGPPAAVGLGRVTGALERPADAALVALHFVGATSAAGNTLGAVVGVARMVERARQVGLAPVLIDTSGLVAGELGRALKHAKIALARPDLLVCLQRSAECEHIVRPYEHARRPALLRLPALGVPGSRTPTERRDRRRRALARYLEGARPAVLRLDRVVLRSPALYLAPPLSPAELAEAAVLLEQDVEWGERRDGGVTLLTSLPIGEAETRAVARALGARPLVTYARSELVGALAGLEDAEGDTLGVGVVRSLDVAARTLTVELTVPVTRIAALTIGRARAE